MELIIGVLVFIGLVLLVAAVTGNLSKITWAAWFGWSFIKFIASSLYSRVKTGWNKYFQKGAKKDMTAPIMKPPPTFHVLNKRKLIGKVK